MGAIELLCSLLKYQKISDKDDIVIKQIKYT